MKLIQVIALHKTLSDIAISADAAPKDFTISLRLMVSENLRQTAPHVNDYDKLRMSLFQQYGTEDKETNQWMVAKESEGFSSFMKEHEKLAESEVEIKLRPVYEVEIGNSPVTITQLIVLQTCGICLSKE